MITVASVLWVGDFKRRRYGPGWVTRLRDMVARNLTLPHRFVCLSNVEVAGIDVIPLAHNWPGWWSKIELFRDHGVGGRWLYLDLDVLITGSLNELVGHPAPLVLTPPHPVLMGRPEERPPRGVTYRYQSSCIAWSPPAGRAIYEKFNPHVMDQVAGDQDWIAKVDDTYPTFDVSMFRKLRQCTDGPPPGVRVVLSMPWKNDEAAKKFPWVQKCWNGLAY